MILSTLHPSLTTLSHDAAMPIILERRQRRVAKSWKETKPKEPKAPKKKTSSEAQMILQMLAEMGIQ